MIPTDDLYLMDVDALHKDLYRMGNSTWPAFTEQRALVDFVITKVDGEDTVLANGNGFSAFDHLTSIMKKPGKKVWRIRKGATLPKEVRLVKDLRPGHAGHYMLAVTENIPLRQLMAIMEQFGNSPQWVSKLEPHEVGHVR